MQNHVSVIPLVKSLVGLIEIALNQLLNHVTQSVIAEADEKA